MLKIATWNVNSLRVRLSHLLDWLKNNQPDIMALQETKVTDDNFPFAEIQATGYQAIFAGQKTYNGVALLSRSLGTEIIVDFPNFTDPQRRILGATYNDLRILNVYAPNGATVDSDKYHYKLNWFKQLQQYVCDSLIKYPRLIVLGDFNIAPQDDDVYDPASLAAGVMVSPLERAALQELLTFGLQDTFRLFTQMPNSFSWWDYRGAGFRRNQGLRIDLILASDLLAPCCTSCVIDTMQRGLERPSDHAPVITTFNY